MNNEWFAVVRKDSCCSAAAATANMASGSPGLCGQLGSTKQDRVVAG